MPNTREKLIELLSQVQDYGTKHTNEQWSVTIETKCNETIADHLIANGVTVQKWIPVSERYPNHGDVVLIYTKGKDIQVFQWDNEYDGWVGDRYNYSTKYVTHWMPLPEPPKGE